MRLPDAGTTTPHLRLARSPATAALAVSLTVVAALYLWQGATGLSLWDEGYLWYGVRSVLQGEVPIRDFMAYDPGRYYLFAAPPALAGDDGIASLRLAIALIQVLALFVTLNLIARSSRHSSLPFLLVSGVVLAAWMVPRHKAIDIAVSLTLLAVLSSLWRDRRPRRHLLAGACIGLAAVFGRNHGLYGAIACATMILLSSLDDGVSVLPKRLALWAAGMAIGYTPVLLMLAFVPGFAGAFIDSILVYVEQGATNLPLPIPWPWLVALDDGFSWNAARSVLIGSAFVLMLAFPAAALGLSVWNGRRGKEVPAVLVAAALLSIPYAHVAFSRAEPSHLAQGAFPMLVGILVIALQFGPVARWTIAALLLGATLVVMPASHSGWFCMQQACTDRTISGSRIRMDHVTAGEVDFLLNLQKEVPAGRSMLVTPYWPGAYAVLGQRSPIWEIYALLPRQPDFEAIEIARIRSTRPHFVLIVDFPLDGREDLRYRNTHPLTTRFIEENYESVDSPHPDIYKLFRERPSLTGSPLD